MLLKILVIHKEILGKTNSTVNISRLMCGATWNCCAVAQLVSWEVSSVYQIVIEAYAIILILNMFSLSFTAMLEIVLHFR